MNDGEFCLFVVDFQQYCSCAIAVFIQQKIWMCHYNDLAEVTGSLSFHMFLSSILFSSDGRQMPRRRSVRNPACYLHLLTDDSDSQYYPHTLYGETSHSEHP